MLESWGRFQLSNIVFQLSNINVRDLRKFELSNIAFQLSNKKIFPLRGANVRDLIFLLNTPLLLGYKNNDNNVQWIRDLKANIIINLM